MSIAYHIYVGSSSGGPVNYAAPVAIVSALTWTSAPLAFGSDTTFAVRAYDTATLLEDRNIDARMRVVTGPAGEDHTGLPNAPSLLAVSPAVAGSMFVSWRYNGGGQGARPTGFRVYAGTPAVGYVTPVATVAYRDDRTPYRATLTGLADATQYAFAVRSYNASGEESNVAVVTATARVAGPDPVQSLAVVVVT